MTDDERPWFIFAHPVGSGHVAVPCVSEEAGRRAMQDDAYKGATFPYEVPLLRTRVCSRAALFASQAATNTESKDR